MRDHDIVGRVAERTQLQALLRDAASGEPRVVTVAGEAGIGKTALIDSFLHSLPKGAVIATGQALPDDPRPLGPMEGLISSLTDDAWCRSLLSVDEAEVIAPEHTSTFEHATNEFDRVVTRWIVGLAARRTLIAVMEDLHVATERAVGLLCSIAIAARERARRQQRCSLLIVSTYRSDPLTPGVHLPQHLLRPAPIASTLDLQPLSAPWVNEILRDRLKITVSGTLLDDLTGVTRGNPLLVEEVARLARNNPSDTYLREVIQEVRQRGLSDAAVAVDARVAELEEPQFQLLAQASVLTPDFDLRELIAATDRQVDDVRHDIEQAWKAGLITGADRYRLAHPLISERVLARVAPHARHQLHANAANAYVSLYRDRVDSSVVAHHLLQARGEADRSLLLAHLPVAIERSFSLGLYGKAGEMSEFLADAFPHDERQAEWRLRAGEAFLRSGNRDECDHNLALANDCSIDIGQRSRAVACRVRLYANLGGRFDATPDARQLLERSDLSPTSRSALLEILSEHATVSYRFEEGAALARESLDAALAADDGAATARAYFGLGLAEMTLLRLDHSLTSFHRAADHARQVSDRWVEAWALGRIPLVEVLRGNLESAVSAAQRAFEHASDIHSWTEAAMAQAGLAAAELARGNLEASETAAQRSLQLITLASNSWSTRVSYPVLSLVRALRGDRLGAHDALDQCEEAGMTVLPGRREVTETLAGNAHEFVNPFDHLSIGGLIFATQAALTASEHSDREKLLVAERVLEGFIDGGGRFGFEGMPAVERSLGRLRSLLGDREGASAAFAAAATTCAAVGAELEGAYVTLDRLHLCDDRPDDAALQRAADIFEERGAIPALQALGVAARRAARQAWAPGVLPPSVVIMVTDLVESTSLSQQVGDTAWRSLQDRVDELVGGLLAEHGGRVFADRGDGVGAWFAEDGAAVSCARAIHTGLASFDVGRGLSLRARIGLTRGQATSRGQDLSGVAVARATRVMTVAGAGKTAFDDTIVVEGRLPLGPQQLKGFNEPVEIFEDVG